MDMNNAGMEREDGGRGELRHGGWGGYIQRGRRHSVCCCRHVSIRAHRRWREEHLPPGTPSLSCRSTEPEKWGTREAQREVERSARKKHEASSAPALVLVPRVQVHLLRRGASVPWRNTTLPSPWTQTPARRPCQTPLRRTEGKPSPAPRDTDAWPTGVGPG